MIKPIEYYTSMKTEDLHGLFSDWYKDIEGCRPRWVSCDDRKTMINWILSEIRPETQAFREETLKEWNANFEEMLRNEGYSEEYISGLI
jgi:hypothetical protein